MVSKSSTRYALGLALLFLLWGCQSPTQPTSNTVPTKIRIRVSDQGGNSLSGAALTLTDTSLGFFAPLSVDRPSATWLYSLQVPIIGLPAYATVDAPPPFGFARYLPTSLRDTLTLPCDDASFGLMVERWDSIPCGTLTAEETMDFGTVCLDQDTVVTLSTPYLVHDCPAGATITAITAPPIPGLKVSARFVNPEQFISGATSWPAHRSLVVTAAFSTMAATGAEVFDGNDIVIDASPNVKITVHLHGRAVSCDSCECPSYSTVVYGVKTDFTGVQIDTNLISMGDGSRTTPVDLSSITNTGKCKIQFTRTKDFSNDQLQVRSFNGGSILSAVLPQNSSLSDLEVLLTPKRHGKILDTTIYAVEKISSDGVVMPCGSLQIVYNGFVGVGACAVDMISTNASSNSYFLDDTITNCVNSDENYLDLCIKNIGDGTLHMKLPSFTQPGFYLVVGATGNRYASEDIVIPAGQSACFSIHYIPSAILPLVSDQLLLCDTVLPIFGRVKDPCINCLDGGLRQYGITKTSHQGFTADSNVFTFISDENAKLDVYAPAVTATNVTFASMKSTTFRLVKSNYTLSAPGITLCDDKAAVTLAAGLCGVGGSSTMTVGIHDLLLFNPVPGKCGLIYIDNIHNSNGIVVVDFQATYPIN